ncbi:NAD(P)/FAD-dependent oxidoreductase [Caldimonas sp. KR1-144]|uniref:NAD(P)/FAD-dependent oxidoreductase n=1 Tax=Caldimonas sp. KR1-144 TaxID=3400911 RepID=UPI003C05DD49
MQQFDVVVVGAGAAGLYGAGIAGQRGLRVLLLDHAERLAEKIRISGGGRCNFTNRDAGPANFLSENPHFCRSALARHRPADFIALLERDRIGWHEKHRGQLFCDESSEDIIRLLVRECESGGVVRRQPCGVQAVRAGRRGFELDTDAGPVATPQLVVATGGLSIPKIGASDWGLRLARQFGHRVVEPRPALVPLTFDAAEWAPYVPLAGVSLEVRAQAGEPGRKRRSEGEFLEDLLFTHRGLSGPAILQISSFWRPGEPITLDLAPGIDLGQALRSAKSGSRRQLVNELGQHLPARLADAWCAPLGAAAHRPMADLPDRTLLELANSLQRWRLTPSGSEGWRKAEVMAGGVDTRELSSQTMESQRQPGLHFIGEVVDVTGWLGGYNFQWAWSSAYACAQALRPAAAFA